MMMKNLKQRRRMKGGTFSGKSERMCYPLSVDVPVLLQGEPQMDDHNGPSPKRYKK